MAIQKELAELKEHNEHQQQMITGQLEHALLEKQRIQNGFELLRKEYSEYKKQSCAETDNLKKQIEHIKADYQSLKHNYENILPENNDLHKRIQEYQRRQDELIAELAAVHQEFSNAKITFTTQIEALQKQQQQAILQNEQLQETVSSLQEQLTQAQKNANVYRRKADLFDTVQAFWQQTINEEEPSAVSAPNDKIEMLPQHLPFENPEPEQAKPVSQETSAAFDEAAPIPAFNLAEQIMAEHRRSISARRQRIEPSQSVPRNEPIRHVVEHFVAHPSYAAQNQSDEFSAAFWTDGSLSAFQQELLKEIVLRDIESRPIRQNTPKAFTMTS